MNIQQPHSGEDCFCETLQVYLESECLLLLICASYKREELSLMIGCRQSHSMIKTPLLTALCNCMAKLIIQEWMQAEYVCTCRFTFGTEG